VGLRGVCGPRCGPALCAPQCSQTIELPQIDLPSRSKVDLWQVDLDLAAR